jgi:two-component system nitrate/nitrite response regulator NarL
METAESLIKVIVVDDHAMFREGLARLIEREPGMLVVAQCESVTSALAALKRSDVTVVILDVDLGRERALDFILEARKRGFAGKVLIVTAGISDLEAVQLVQAGISGILHKQQSAETLRGAIRQVASGGVYLERDYLPSLFRNLDRTRPAAKPQISPREKDTLRNIFQGLTNKEIGDRLDISEAAVKAALRLLFEKLGARTRAQLVKIALEQYREQL